MPLKRILKKALSFAGYRLVPFSSRPELSLDIISEKRQIKEHDYTLARPRGDLEGWFRQGRQVRIQKWFHYFEIYERYFAAFRGRPIKVLEIGVSKGGSLPMWRSYFGAASTIVGLDIDPACKKLEHASDNIHVRIGDQESHTFLTSVREEFGPFDIIIDDGGHTTSQQIQSFLQLYFFAMKEDGVYVVEDLHTNYWKSYMTSSDGLTFVDLAAKLVHLLNDAYEGDSEKVYRFNFGSADRFKTLEVSAFCAQTRSINFHDSVIVFERGRKTIPYFEER